MLQMAVGPCFVLPTGAPPGSSLGKYVTEAYYLSLRNGLVRELDAHYYTPPPVPTAINAANGTRGGMATADHDAVYKAVTVGAAHAVCATPQDRLMQLQTFAGTEMRIKGVQQQPTVGKGVLVLITGVSIRSATSVPTTAGAANGGQQQQQQQLLPFCHTLILTPVLAPLVVSAATGTTTTIGYQILNDNLVILTGDE